MPLTVMFHRYMTAVPSSRRASPMRSQVRALIRRGPFCSAASSATDSAASNTLVITTLFGHGFPATAWEEPRRFLDSGYRARLAESSDARAPVRTLRPSARRGVAGGGGLHRSATGSPHTGRPSDPAAPHNAGG